MEITPNGLQLWHATHDGIWLGGHSVIVAKDEEQARHLLAEEMKAHGLKEDVVYDLKLLMNTTTWPGCFIVSNGDY